MDATQAYDAKLVILLEALWGDGYLSPGGCAEIDRVLAGLDLTGCHVLDIGCGTGGAALHIQRKYGPAATVGIDPEPGVVAKAQSAARAAGLTCRLTFQTIAPGPLPFPDASFDVVFSKDSIVHIADKHAIAADIARVLKPGGVFAASDWMLGADVAPSPALLRYLELEGLGFGAASPDRYFAALRAAGFERVGYEDRTSWLAALTHKEVAQLEGPLNAGLRQSVGAEFLAHEIEVWRALSVVLDGREFGPGIWRASLRS